MSELLNELLEEQPVEIKVESQEVSYIITMVNQIANNVDTLFKVLDAMSLRILDLEATIDVIFESDIELSKRVTNTINNRIMANKQKEEQNGENKE